MGDEEAAGDETLSEALDAFAVALRHRLHHRNEHYARRGRPLAEPPLHGVEPAVDEAAGVDRGAAAAEGAPRTEKPMVLVPAPPPADPSQWSAGTKLEYLRVRNLGDCRRCDLCEGRQRIVFGEGDPGARVMIVGEGPGGDEDRLGRPFVGAAGRRLDQWIEQLGLRRDAVYITNVVKCRPPGNRNPSATEIERCAPFLAAQIRAVSPALIVALGRIAGNHLLGRDLPLKSMKGRVHAHVEAKSGRRIPLVVVYHPAYVLRRAQDAQGGPGSEPVARALPEETELLDSLRAALRYVLASGSA